MTVTGSGTQADPYIVHSYSEIKTTINGIGSSTKCYMKLANDINCNDYGNEFSWNISTTGSENANFDFDLDGHTIKNIKIATGGCLFILSRNASSRIHDGKILNIFINNARLFNKQGNASYIPDGILENLSISLDCTNCTDNIFSDVKIMYCAIYIQASILRRSIFYLRADYDATIRSSDILLNIKDTNQSITYGQANAVLVYDTRIRGKVAYTQSNVFVFNRSQNSGCVINLELSGVGYGYLTYTSTVTDKSSVINSDILGGATGNSYTECTATEIVNGDSLRAKGFMVINVVGD